MPTAKLPRYTLIALHLRWRGLVWHAHTATVPALHTWALTPTTALWRLERNLRLDWDRLRENGLEHDERCTREPERVVYLPGTLKKDHSWD